MDELLTTDLHPARALRVRVDEDSLTVDLVDGRCLSVPLAWYPRLSQGTPEEVSNWQVIGRGQGVHWPELDEDVSVENLLAGKPSGESQRSFKKWLEGRKNQSDQAQCIGFVRR